ncbi:histidine phosphatase family protein [Bacillus salacetis]|uniref:Histidine phosphatase family protein n=1 Tax=Bacillus salacetis TaxID=2315464 RepID=A0A3A1R4G9_9BACI|nr:histidine phosphatase family protein [Bacillus salacetis]RIW37257.1 histidine phosphatase family protein [Bacillus salacetis]
MIYVVRHGQTKWNEEGRLQGRNGKPLNFAGKQQAEHLKSRLGHIKFDLVFSSPQQRAIETAEIAAGSVPIIEKRLDVFDLGEADGLRKEEAKLKGMLPDASIYHGVERSEEFIARIYDFLTELKENLNGKTPDIFISGHRCTTGAIGAYFNGIPEDRNILRWSSDNGDYKTYSY